MRARVRSRVSRVEYGPTERVSATDFVGQRLARRHFRDIVGRMQVVAVDEWDFERLCDPQSDCRFAAAIARSSARGHSLRSRVDLWER